MHHRDEDDIQAACTITTRDFSPYHSWHWWMRTISSSGLNWVALGICQMHKSSMALSYMNAYRKAA